MRAGTIVKALLGGIVLAPAQTPPKVFELQIPEFQDRRFDGDIVEAPLSRITKLVINVLDPVASDVSYGKIYPKLNGDAASVIGQYRSTSQGKAVILDLTMRADIKLKPGANSLEVTAVNHRGRRYYKNWLLRTREQARNEWFAYDLFTSPSDETGSPPDILLSEPDTPIVFDGSEPARKVRVKGSATCARALRAATIDGKPIAFQQGKDSIDFDQQVTVPRTAKQIAIEISDEKSNRTRVLIPVMPAERRAPPKFTGDRYALVIGISKYRSHPGGPRDLSSPAADADRLASLLSRTGFPAEHVLVLRDDAATLAQTRNAFRNFVAKAKPDDLLLIYFAGHGLHDPVSPEKIYLAAHDTQVRQLPETGIELSELETLLSANVRSRNTILLFDVGRKPGEDYRFEGNNLVNAYLLRLFSKEQGRAVMVSAGINEISEDSQRSGESQGLFGRSFLEGLSGDADWNHDGLVTVAELFRYVSEKVRAASGGAQKPEYEMAQTELPVSSRP